MDRRELPIFEIERALLERVAAQGRVIVQAPTGSGKSTQIPQMLLDHGLLGKGQVVILQPRRLATRMLAARVAAERGSRLGDEVGYQIRFEDVSSARTRIKYETEGILLRQMLTNPNLDGVTAILFDEFHERHLYGDITLARALGLQESSRPDLKLLVMSATLDAGLLERYLAPCALLTSEGRTYPVAVEYLEGRAPTRPSLPIEDVPAWELAAREFERLMGEGVEGDFLVFMPGAYEIGRTVQAIRNSSAARGCIVLPLHGELSVNDQDAAVARYDQRKVVVSTNVAESSLTIDGVRVVLDSGLARIPRFDPYRGINTLLIERISRASADQRAGRAGRTAPGRCIRLWTEREHRERAPQELPEVKRLDLAEIVLTLKASGVDDVRAFRWLEPPEPRSLDRAELLLRDLGAIDSHAGRITELGRRMLSFPVHPRYSRMLIAANEFGCVRTVALIAALTQGRNVLQRRQGSDVKGDREDLLGEEAESDFFILMRAWRYADQHRYDVDRCRRLGIHAQSARQVGPLFDYFLRIAKDEGLRIEDKAPDSEAIQKAVLAGFSDQLARRVDSGTLRCQLVHGRKGQLARESVVQRSPLFVAAEVREIEGKDRELNVLLSLATAVEPAWLREMFPDDFSETVDVSYDSAAKRVIGQRQVLFRDLPLESKRGEPPADEAAAILAMEVLKGNLTLKSWDHSVDQWMVRVNCLARWCPELQVPPITGEDKDAMIRRVCLGAASYKEIKERPVWGAVKSHLTGAQQALVEKHAPERINLPNGRHSKVTYSLEQPPFIAVRIQDLYDVKQTPRLAMNRIPVVVHILGPNQRPVQVTQDLAGFWREHYPRIKQELQRKYPKHEWR
jgi:ATP-dependent helicase HrpB